MPSKPNARNWNDVQTAIATAAIVTTIGLWNLIATPAKTIIAQAQPQEPNDTSVPPPTEPAAAAQEPVSMPKVKIMFTQAGQQTATVAAAQPQAQQVQPQVKKKKKKNGSPGAGGGSPSVTQTKSS
jgi:hypothetical protein